MQPDRLLLALRNGDLYVSLPRARAHDGVLIFAAGAHVVARYLVRLFFDGRSVARMAFYKTGTSSLPSCVRPRPGALKRLCMPVCP